MEAEHTDMPADLRRDLQDFFQPHNDMLFRMIGRAFDHWRPQQ
jgi:hypothetical protein